MTNPSSLLPSRCVLSFLSDLHKGSIYYGDLKPGKPLDPHHSPDSHNEQHPVHASTPRRLKLTSHVQLRERSCLPATTQKHSNPTPHNPNASRLPHAATHIAARRPCPPQRLPSAFARPTLTPSCFVRNVVHLNSRDPHQTLLLSVSVRPTGNVILKDVYPCGSEGGCLNVRVVDFGCSQLVVPGTPLRGMSGSPLFVAPEIIGGAYGLPADM